MLRSLGPTTSFRWKRTKPSLPQQQTFPCPPWGKFGARWRRADFLMSPVLSSPAATATNCTGACVCEFLKVPSPRMPQRAPRASYSILIGPRGLNVRLLLNRFAPIAASYTAAKCGPIR
jgi:hypothetical protein